MTDPGLLHDAMAAAAQGTVRRAFFQAVRDTRNVLDRDALTAALERGNIAAAVSIFRDALDAEGFHRVGLAISDAAIRAGRSAAAEVDAHLKGLVAKREGRPGQRAPTPPVTTGRIRTGDLSAEHSTRLSYGAATFADDSLAKRDLRFNILDPRLVAAVQGWARAAVDGLTAQAQVVTLRVVRAGLTAGQSAATIVRALVASVGLSERDAERVERYEAALVAGERDAIGRAARDPRADATVLRAVAERKPLDPAYIAGLANRMRTRLLAERGFRVAEWQAKQIAAGSLQAAWQQAASEGLVEAGTVVKRWINRDDGRVRPSHVRIPLDHPDGIPLEAAFASILGPIRYPFDPEAVLANVANCRCVLAYGVRN